MESGELLASGRAADVFDLGDGSVLRRYRTDRDCAPEATLMTWLYEAGIPVPRVRSASGRDIVMERIPGVTMLEDLEARPWKVVSHIRTLANLQKSINGMEAPAWVRTDERIPTGRALLHLDLHPMNVIMSPRGPIVIDWTNARRGDADFDAAVSYLLMASFEAHGARETIAQQLVTRLFRAFRGRSEIARRMVNAARYRLADPNVTAGERTALELLLSKNDASVAPPLWPAPDGGCPGRHRGWHQAPARRHTRASGECRSGPSGDHRSRRRDAGV